MRVIKVLSERVDRNGTKVQTVLTTCERCGGAGGHKMWEYTGFTCYKCGGSGVQEGTHKVYTPEHEAKLAARREQKHQKRLEEARANAAAENKEKLEKWGLTGELVYFVLGNTYRIKDELKEAGARFSSAMEGWFFQEKPEAWETLELQTADLLQYNDLGQVGFRPWGDIKEHINGLQKAATPESAWVGNVGDKVELALTVVKSFWIETQYGHLCINKLQDDAGNIFVWKTGSCNLENEADEKGRVTLKGAIKDHDEYNDEKQTVLTRCRVIEKASA